MRLHDFLNSCSKQEIQLIEQRLGFHRHYLRRICRGERRPSPETALSIEKITKGVVQRWELRPDIWQRPTRAKANGSKSITQRKARALA